MRRLQPLRLLALLLVLAALARGGWEGRGVHAPVNVILISLDTLRADHVGDWGYERPTSPRLDEFAKRSVVFRRAVAQGSSTIPSHASLFTSQYASAVRAAPRGYLAQWPDTLAEILSRAGFATWGFVDGGNMRRRFGFAQGFDHYEDDYVRSRRLVRRVRSWLTEHPEEPFFLFLHTYDVHAPYDAGGPYVRLFGDPSYPIRTDHWYLSAVDEKRVEMTPRDREELVARYDAGIRRTDEQIGDLLDWLAERGLLERSVIVILSDHGEEFGEHGRMGHWQIFLDPNVRVPLVIHVPGIEPQVVHDTVELTDVLPTILDLVGLPIPEEAVGQTLVPTLLGQGTPKERVAYSERGSRSARTVIDDRYQLLRDEHAERYFLFDLREDPGATRDVWAERPEVAAKLEKELVDRREAAKETVARHFDTPEPTPAEIGDEIRRELEALGYLSPEEPPAAEP